MMDFAPLVSQFIEFSRIIVETTGFPGLFIVNLLSSATIIFPVPAILVTFAFASVANPVLVGIVAGAGNAIGELTGYYVGVGSREVLKKKQQKWIKKTKQWSKHHGIFPVIILFAVTPLPSDVVGILAGVIRYDVRKFFLASLIGKIILNLMVAFAGFYGIEAILTYLGGA